MFNFLSAQINKQSLVQLSSKLLCRNCFKCVPYGRYTVLPFI